MIRHPLSSKSLGLYQNHSFGIMDDMTHTAEQLSDGLVQAVIEERDRQGLSSRELARRMGVNAQFVSSRIDGGNPRTGERILITFRDAAAFAIALGVPLMDLAFRAEALADGGQVGGDE